MYCAIACKPICVLLIHVGILTLALVLYHRPLLIRCSIIRSMGLDCFDVGLMEQNRKRWLSITSIESNKVLFSSATRGYGFDKDQNFILTSERAGCCPYCIERFCRKYPPPPPSHTHIGILVTVC